MKYLLLTDLKLGLDDLLTHRVQALRLSSIGQKYESSLKEQYQSICALPATLENIPLAEELAALDDVHDGYGYAIHHIMTAYLKLPDIPDDLHSSAKRIQAAFAPTLALFSKSYASEAQKAKENQAMLTELEADLKAFPIWGNQTLLDWAKALVSSGLELERVLSSRADQTSAGDTALRKQAAVLRMKALSSLNKLRSAVQEEVTLDESLPRDLEYQIFDYLDLMERNRANGSKG